MPSQQRLFTACIISMVATSFGFISRAFLLDTLGVEFNLNETEKGSLAGAGLFPFALSIIFFSLIVDRVGYGRCMVFAWLGHTVSGILMITAKSFPMLYIGTLLFALANGTVEAVINPMTTSLFPRQKTHYLNILHSGWPGGFVLGGLLFMLLGDSVGWKVKMALYLIPTLAYGLMLLGQRFPVQERVSAGVSFEEMLKEFGWAGCFIVSIFIVFAFDSVFTSLRVYENGIAMSRAALIAAIPTMLFVIRFRSFGRPMFIFLLLLMILLATTELGTDSWVAALMKPIFKSANAGYLVLIYTAAIMFVLRFCAGPIVHRISPLGLLASCAALAAVGLVLIAKAGNSAALVFGAATLYGVGKTFFWPTTLGVVSEQFPKGGAMTISAIGGMGMISAGVLGGALLGAMQDQALDRGLHEQNPAIYAKIAEPSRTAYLMTYQPLDKEKERALPEAERKIVEEVRAKTSQSTLAEVAVLPAIMCVCYLGLIAYFRARGGYKPVELTSAG